MKILIVGFGIAGIYASFSLKNKNLDIISSDVNLSKEKYDIGCGKANQWGGILYHFSKALFFSFESGKIEELELEDLQGVSGLKALRVEINYLEDYEHQSAKAMDELIKNIQE